MRSSGASSALTFRRAAPAVLASLVERGALFGVGRLLRQANARAFAHLDAGAAKFSVPLDLVEDTQGVLLYFLVQFAQNKPDLDFGEVVEPLIDCLAADMRSRTF